MYVYVHVRALVCVSQRKLDSSHQFLPEPGAYPLGGLTPVGRGLLRWAELTHWATLADWNAPEIFLSLPWRHQDHDTTFFHGC